MITREEMRDVCKVSQGSCSKTCSFVQPLAVEEVFVVQAEMLGKEVVDYPGAVAPDRFRSVNSHGLEIAVYEWGDSSAPPVMMAHGGFDFARTLDVFAPLIAARGWRVISWDQRGHGDSEHAALYSWDADVRDALAVFDSVSSDPVPVLGHSKGGSLMLVLAEACPHRVSRLVNIDGLPAGSRSPDIADHERIRLMADTLKNWLDHRRRAAEAVRKAGTIDELAERRGRMNPRLSREWLRYLVTVGARRDEDGWRWKIDPALRFGGFGPWRPEWTLDRLVSVQVPMIGMLGMIPEEMGWGTNPEDLRPYMPRNSELHVFEDSGHFIHIEKPVEVAEIILDFLSQP